MKVQIWRIGRTIQFGEVLGNEVRIIDAKASWDRFAWMMAKKKIDNHRDLEKD